MKLFAALVLATGTTSAAARGHAGPRAHELSSEYTFAEYKRDFGKEYDSTTRELQAEKFFEAELARVRAHNSAGVHSYTMGINQFSDIPEPVKGYVLPPATAKTFAVTPLPFELDKPEDLPARVDWREVPNTVTATKDQGGCGSCWAFAATSVVESHVALATSVLFNLAPQELVSCMQNPSQCGGTGGCKGATCELAFDFFKKEGILEEYQLGYSSYGGDDGVCPFNVSASLSAASAAEPLLRGPDPPGISGAVATIEGYVKLPENEYLPLLNAVAKVGPIAITVDAAWSGYESGVFEQADYSNYNLDHAVVLVGYGTDEESGHDYWLVRNSWAPTWGEGGYIRLKRNDPSKVDPSAVCGVDTAPCDGTGCAPQDCNTTVKVCGTSGILYDASYPTGAGLNKK